jgi:hypothetical protein
MRQKDFFGRSVAVMSIVGMLIGQFAQAAGPQPVSQEPRANSTQPLIGDIQLSEGGTLRGLVLDSSGGAQASAPIALYQDGHVITTVCTGPSGEFAISQLTAGIYELQTPAGRTMYRLWAPNTAPPVAQDGIVMIDGQNIVRGQHERGAWLGHVGSALANPWILAIIVAAAIAIPLALDDDDDAS